MNLSRRFSILASSLPISSFIPSAPPSIAPISQTLLPHIDLVNSIKSSPADIIHQIKRLPQFDSSTIYHDNHQVELATLLHAMIVSAYYWHSDPPLPRIPSNIAIPFCDLNKHLSRAPVLTIISTQFYNWKLKDESKPFHPNNIEALFTFSGTEDEVQFYHCATYIEYLGNSIINAIPSLYNGALAKNEIEVKNSLKIFAKTLKEAKKALGLVYQKVDPNVFYFGFRKYLKSFDGGVIYEGVSDTPQKLMGPTAAQSPLMRLVDTIFDLNSNNEFLLRIPMYMQKEHRDLVAFAERNRPNNLREAAISLNASDEWNSAIGELCNFRSAHSKLAYNYIIKPSQGGESKGTGGSSLEAFLSALIENTKNLMISK
uniref:Indoleamine 2,3-dioxyganese-IV n=1 Tax=Blepharisma stoltei TaxID=1481888 RepID=A0A286T920_9CILI|nr:indoleamine 2,3-dioxyganese - IV [Blepharisma stoltei]